MAEMAKKSIKASEDKRPISRAVILRMLIILTLDVIVGVLLKMMRDGEAGLEIYFGAYCVAKPTFSIVCGAIALLAVGVFVWTLAAKKDTSSWVITPLMAAGIFAFLAVVPLIFIHYYINRYLVTVVVMVIASVLYFVYNLFMHIFYR